ncbi:uncharacterized protein BP5553_06397 [Venustampulla echinocandica]|uniref:Tyrosine specific protein phosphatases domain-containing protein n=1 Tax=Venustampulla echinocandica TaxID=2656787 RepID=A0A370TJT6_9HELO|nr:uncharacterized protein BP5553_06397 [Venustampulla echinocandica]RDL35785.1 hypothetical protein BP5553_06397 [Venustampulla echinocandica]
MAGYCDPDACETLLVSYRGGNLIVIGFRNNHPTSPCNTALDWLDQAGVKVAAMSTYEECSPAPSPVLFQMPYLDTPPRAEDTGPMGHFVDTRAEASMVTVSQRIGATAAGEFAWRPPSPPHIAIPQPAEDNVFVIPEYDGFEVDADEREILKIITHGGQEQVASGMTGDWQYEWRRNAQCILSFLYLGPSSAARDIDYLRSEGITMLLVIRNTTTAQARLLGGEKVANQLGIQAAAVDVEGNPQLIAAFPAAIKIINDHLISIYRQNMFKAQNRHDHIRPIQGKVLVFCETGNERSTAVIAAYLMNMYYMDLVTTIQYIQSHRFCIALDDGLKNLLLSYHDLLQARKAVAGAAAPWLDFGRGNKPASKRGRDEVDDNNVDDMDTMTLDDIERFDNRAGFVPFRDGPSQ